MRYVILGGSALFVGAMVVLAVVLYPIVFPRGEVVGAFDMRDPRASVTVQARVGDRVHTRASFEADIDGDALETMLLEVPLLVRADGPSHVEARCELSTGSAYSSETSPTHGKVTGIPNDCVLTLPAAGAYAITVEDPFANHVYEKDGKRGPMPFTLAELEVRLEKKAQP